MRPQVSATHLPGEQLAVTVHGTAHEVDTSDGPFRQALADIYVPRYGQWWIDNILDAGSVYARIDAERMFAFYMDES